MTDAGMPIGTGGSVIGSFDSLINVPDGYEPIRVSICLFKDLSKLFLFSMDTMDVATDVSDNR